MMTSLRSMAVIYGAQHGFTNPSNASEESAPTGNTRWRSSGSSKRSSEARAVVDGSLHRDLTSDHALDGIDTAEGFISCSLKK